MSENDRINNAAISPISFPYEDMLRRVEQLKREIESYLPLDARVQEQIARRFYVDWTYHSCNLEGNSYTRGETEMALVYDRPAAGKPGREYREVIGHGKAIKIIEELARSAMPLTESDIKELNKLVLGEQSYESPARTTEGLDTLKTIIPGTYKTLPNHVRTATGEVFRYADPIEVVPRMAELLDWYRAQEENKTQHPIVIAAEFHFRFVRIHPFDDGNGRIARILMNYVLLRNGYPIIIIPTEEKDRYISALERADLREMAPFYSYLATREIESQNLWLRGARGESLEDVEKEAAILKASLQNPQKKVNPLLLEKKIRRVIFDTFEPFVEFAAKKLEVFDDFFQEHGLNLIVTVNDGEHKADFERLKELPVEQFRLHSVRVVFFWEEFKIHPAAGRAQIRIEYKFSETGYSVTSEFGNRPPASASTKVFGESLNDIEQTALVQGVSSQFLHYIRLVADQAGYVIPDFSTKEI